GPARWQRQFTFAQNASDRMIAKRNKMATASQQDFPRGVFGGSGSERGASPPPNLPHQGGGVGRWLRPDRAPNSIQHLPLDGGGWEGVTGTMTATSYKKKRAPEGP